jgi:transposase-like protein
MSTRKNRKHSLSEKLKVIEYYQSGYGSSTIAKKLDIPRCIVSRWIRVYQEYGLKGFEKQSFLKLSTEIKQQAVKDILEKHLSFETVALKYQVSTNAIYCWTQRVKQQGYSSLLTIKQGRPRTTMGRPKKREPETELEKLQAELKYLRAENAYLKKLKALEEEEQAALLKAREPKSSKH